jgi:hypothetical protein
MSSSQNMIFKNSKICEGWAKAHLPWVLIEASS